MKINFIGIGAQKCASTWVHTVLSEHPAVFHSDPKELDYFSYFFGKGRYWYHRFFDAAEGQVWIGENSPSYFHHPLAPERAYRYNPEMRIVLALRDPIERAFSNHLHMIKSGYLTGPDLCFEYGLANNEMYLEQSRYATHLQRWLEHFPREHVHVVLQEEIQADPLGMARDLYRFLGIQLDFQAGSASRRANESRVSKHPGMDAALKRIGSAARGLGLGSVVEGIKHNVLVERMRRANQQDLRTFVPPMREETRSALLANLAPELLALREILQRDSLPWPSWVDLGKKTGGQR